MRGNKSYKKHQTKLDYLYGRVDMGRFINYLMRNGEKSVAEKVFYKTLDEVEGLSKKDPAAVFESALLNAAPQIEVASRRVGGANYQVPIEVRPERKFYLSAKWIIEAAKKARGKPMDKRLAAEIVAAAKNEGAAVKRKQDTHRVAEANRAFASFIRKKS